MSTPAPSSNRFPRDWFRSPVSWLGVPLVVATAALIWRLWGEWTSNPDLSHGLFAPVIFGLLLWEGTRRGPQRWLPHSWALGAAALLATSVAVVLFGVAGLLAATVGWGHSVVNFVLAAALAAVWFGALLLLASERVRVLPFNWTVLTAIGLWVLAAPLPEGTYQRLMLTLQHSVTTGVLNSLHLLGIPARQMGNVIQLAATSVGVEEACSGIRSLISCLYAGFFFAAWLVDRPVKRAFLIIVAPVMAVVMNFIRSLALTLMANAGTDISGFWHDATGYAILGVTALALAGLASLLSSPPASAAETANVPATPQPAPRALFAGFAALSGVALALAIFFVGHQHTAAAVRTPTDSVPPERLIPETAAGWQVETARDLYRFSGLLRTRQLAERTYLKRTPEGIVQITLYVAHWAPGEASVSLVAAHTPDACWPGGGWVVGPVAAPQVALAAAGRTLSVAEHRFFKQGALPQHVWFWHVYDGRVINYRDPYSVPALLEIAWNYGFRREGSQYFVRLSSNQPWEKIADEPLVHEISARLAAVGI